MKSTLLYDRVEGLGDFRDSAVLDQDARLQLIAHDDWGRRRDAFARDLNRLLCSLVIDCGFKE